MRERQEGHITNVYISAVRRTLCMAWQETFPGNYEFKGAITEWVGNIKHWHAQDSRANRCCHLLIYMQCLVLLFAATAKRERETSWLDCHKAAKLDKILEGYADGGIEKMHVKIFDTLDFLAQHLDAKARCEWSTRCRAETKRHLKFK